ncbi:5551_t:CDS:1, partial [Acaulospora colombiana]
MAPSQTHDSTLQLSEKPRDLSIVIPLPERVPIRHETHTEQLAHDVSELSLSPFSVILTNENFAEIATWID